MILVSLEDDLDDFGEILDDFEEILIVLERFWMMILMMSGEIHSNVITQPRGIFWFHRFSCNDLAMLTS